MKKTKEFSWISSAWVQTNEVRYIYDGNLVIQERDVNNSPIVTYTRGKDLSGFLEGAGGIGGLLARSETATSYFHADGNGNVTALVGTNQLLVAKYHYDPFGNTLSMSGSMAEVNLYRFSSKEWHANSGLVYYLYRFYEPNLQRWVNRDPLGEAGFEALWSKKVDLIGDGPNSYVFVMNSPISGIDAFGLNSLRQCLAACAGGSAARERFCRCIPHPAVRAGCWAIVGVSYIACSGWCYWNFSE